MTNHYPLSLPRDVLPILHLIHKPSIISYEPLNILLLLLAIIYILIIQDLTLRKLAPEVENIHRVSIKEIPVMMIEEEVGRK